MKRPKPDHRLSWRDPSMPVLRDYTFQNGTKRTVIDPEFEQEWRKYCMEINNAPSWRDDPTYDLKKQRKRL